MGAARASRVGLAVLAGAALAGCAKQGATVQGQEIHNLYVTIALLAAPVFVGVEGALLWCVLRYRRRGEGAAGQGSGGRRSLAVFFAIPTVIVAFLYPSASGPWPTCSGRSRTRPWSYASTASSGSGPSTT
jgi:heme/copper-type cytochrome/quinol oxidase subunit 2